MKAESRGLCEIFSYALDDHANDRNLVGQIALFSLGIDGVCLGFNKCKHGGYNIFWGLDNGDEYIRTFSETEIKEALSECKFKLSIEVTKIR